MLKKSNKDLPVAVLFLLPSLIGFVVFTGIPIIAALVLSFYDWNLLTTPKFIGLQNYQNLFGSDPIFLKVLWNTLYFVLGSVPLSIILALIVALLLNQKLKAVAFLRAGYFLPVVSSIVAASLVWKWIFNPDFGIVNDLLRMVGISNPPKWITSTVWAMPSIIIVAIWKNVGYNMVIFLAGLQDIPKDLYEAGEIDGANKWQLFWNITLPMLSPTTFFITVISIIGSFQVFGQALVMTEGGPGISTNTIVFYIYQNAFVFFKMGYAAASAWVLFFIILLFTLIQARIGKKRGAL
ncbi:carbohydrate ABC transporter permease [Paenibacillus sp. FSL H8-0034]|uniref:carbohydrate ABC transporter permease n=1 Tax=Paenibacillus sp. FSL H8-0034 TaxID=2954671 RepID=UPI0030F7CA09